MSRFFHSLYVGFWFLMSLGFEVVAIRNLVNPAGSYFWIGVGVVFWILCITQISYHLTERATAPRNLPWRYSIERDSLGYYIMRLSWWGWDILDNAATGPRDWWPREVIEGTGYMWRSQSYAEALQEIYTHLPKHKRKLQIATEN